MMLGIGQVHHTWINRNLVFIYVLEKQPNIRGVDTHGAGAMRGDPKSGDPSEYPTGSGPQMDEVRIMNLVESCKKH